MNKIINGYTPEINSIIKKQVFIKNKVDIWVSLVTILLNSEEAMVIKPTKVTITESMYDNGENLNSIIGKILNKDLSLSYTMLFISTSRQECVNEYNRRIYSCLQKRLQLIEESRLIVNQLKNSFFESDLILEAMDSNEE